MSQNQQKGHERRTFPRVKYRAYAELATSNERWPAHVIDLSFHGALIAIIQKHHIDNGEEIQLTVETGQGEEPLRMVGHVAHQNAHMLGIECRANGIDQQQRLRQLVRQSPSIDYMNRSVQTMMDEHKEHS